MVKYDVLCLTEVGLNRDRAAAAEIPGFTCVKVLARPNDAEHGGVAVFVKRRLAHLVSVCREHENLGILWVKLQGRPTTTPVFIAACYIPHKEKKIQNTSRAQTSAGMRASHTTSTR